MSVSVPIAHSSGANSNGSVFNVSLYVAQFDLEGTQLQGPMAYQLSDIAEIKEILRRRNTEEDAGLMGIVNVRSLNNIKLRLG